MKRFAALFFILSLFLIPASALEEEEIHTFPIDFAAVADSLPPSAALLALPETGVFDTESPSYGAQLKDDALAVAAYELLMTQLDCEVTQLELDVSAYNLTLADWSPTVVRSLNAAVAAYVYDHPESQFCTIGRYGYAASGVRLTKVLYIVEQTSYGDAWKSGLEDYISDFTASFDRTLPVIEQYRAIHDLVCRTVTYDDAAAAAGVPSDAHTVFGALVLDNMAVCEGYAKAFKVLCDAVDLPCMLIVGEANQNGIFYGYSNHMWNAVPVDGKWYAVDPTWDDESTNYRMNTISVTPILYDYFLNNAPFQEGSPVQDHRSTGNIYFADDFPMVFALPELTAGSCPGAAIAPTEGTVTFTGGSLAFPHGFWDVTFSDGFTPGSLTTIRLAASGSLNISAPLELPAGRTFLCSAPFLRATGFDDPIFSVSGRLDLSFPLEDSNYFTLTDDAVVNLKGGLQTERFVMDRGTVHISGELLSCVDYNGGTLTHNGEAITADYHHFDGSGSCLCGAMTGCPHSFAELVDDAFLVSEATCTSPATYYLSCEFCGTASLETFEHGGPADHTYTDKAEEQYLCAAATCSAPATYFKSCSVCGAAGEETFTFGAPADHTYTDKAEEQYLCAAATCSSPATYFKSCSVCGAAGEETFEHGDLLPHSFTQSENDDYLATPASCIVPATYFVSCEFCGLTGTDTFSAGALAEHTALPVLQSLATCTSPSMFSDVCLVCGSKGEPYPVGLALPHDYYIFEKTAATCTSPAIFYDVCAVCGHETEPYPDGEPGLHTDPNGDLICDECGGDLSDGSVGILALTGDSVTIRTDENVTDVIICVAAYEHSRMTGVVFQRVTVQPGQLYTLDFTLSGAAFDAFVLDPVTFAPLYVL